jgi:hypothetical protein
MSSDRHQALANWPLGGAVAKRFGLAAPPHWFAIDVRFKSPLRIPGRAHLLSVRRADGWRLRVESPDGEHGHLVGTIG